MQSQHYGQGKGKLGGEARSKEEAGNQKGKQLVRNRKTAGRSSRAEGVALPDPKPTALCLRDKQLSSLRIDVQSYRCWKVPPFPWQIPQHLQQLLFTLWVENLRKMAPWKCVLFWQWVLTQMKIYKSPQIKELRSSLLLFHFIVGRIKANTCRLSLIIQLGYLFQSHHGSPQNWNQKKNNMGTETKKWKAPWLLVLRSHFSCGLTILSFRVVVVFQGSLILFYNILIHWGFYLQLFLLFF